MAGTRKNKADEENKPLHGADPAVVAKVDRMMSTDTPASPGADKGGPSSAPLLPDEKLPDFNKGLKKTDQPDKPPIIKQKNIVKPKRPEPTPATAEKIPPVDDPLTGKAVDDISREESDRMLAIEDAKAEMLSEGTAEIDRGNLNRIKAGLKAFWQNKRARNTTLAGILTVIIIAGVVPVSRYFILNTLGVRGSMSLRVVDDKTDQPLKNVQVELDGTSGKTDIDGKVKLERIKLGPAQLSVKKPAFADVRQKVTIGWGSNPRGDLSLTPVGSRYTFEIKDFVSGKPVKDAEAVSGEASASANDNGEIVLVVADQDEASIDIELMAPNYRTETVKLEVGNKDVHQLSLVPGRKHAFVSKRSGQYDLYKIDVDGKNEKKVISGTGSESEDKTVILPSPDSNTIAFVSTRGDRHNGDGFALSGLMIINLDDNKSETIDYSERIQLIDFIGSRLIYVKIAEGESASSPDRNRLISYDVGTHEQKELYKTNYFNDVLAAKGIVYYAPASYMSEGSDGLFKVNADGSSKSTVYPKEVWNLFRVSYDVIDAAVGESWYKYDTSSGVFQALSGAPAEQKSRVYADSPDRKKSAWVDERDGKGVLIIYDTLTGQDKVIQTQGGLANPISWLDNDHLIYRIANSSETADYVISLSGGSPKKVRDVTNTAGLDRWYYY